MIPIERVYRTRLLIERVDSIRREIWKMGESLYRTRDDRELIALNQAGRALQTTVRALEQAEMEVCSQVQPEILAAQLAASMELIGESPERMRRQKVKENHAD